MPDINKNTLEEWVASRATESDTPASDRDDLELPEVWVESIEELSKNVDTVVKPLFDMLFQCFNEHRCELYDTSSNWKPNV